MSNHFATLRRMLVEDYDALKHRLSRRFGSTDFAGEVLHEAWLRLDRLESAGPGAGSAAVQNPGAYLYRVALNIAADQKRGDQRWLAKVEIEALCQEAAQGLDPVRHLEARSELLLLSRALDQLPPRRRLVFIASRLEHLPHKEIAARYNLTVRIVDREVKAALDHFAEVLQKKVRPRRGPDPLKPSS